jgi:hypothetical protein
VGLESRHGRWTRARAKLHRDPFTAGLLYGKYYAGVRIVRSTLRSARRRCRLAFHRQSRRHRSSCAVSITLAGNSEVERALRGLRPCDRQWGGKQTAPIGSFPPNKFRLYDMVGRFTGRPVPLWKGRHRPQCRDIGRYSRSWNGRAKAARVVGCQSDDRSGLPCSSQGMGAEQGVLNYCLLAPLMEFLGGHDM